MMYASFLFLFGRFIFLSLWRRWSKGKRDRLYWYERCSSISIKSYKCFGAHDENIHMNEVAYKQKQNISIAISFRIKNTFRQGRMRVEEVINSFLLFIEMCLQKNVCAVFCCLFLGCRSWVPWRSSDAANKKNNKFTDISFRSLSLPLANPLWAPVCTHLSAKWFSILIQWNLQ